MRLLRAPFLLCALACGDSPDTPAEETLVVWALDDAPLVGVTVAFDPPGGGQRITRTTDAEGRVVFQANFESGPGIVTLASPDHVLLSDLDASPRRTRANDFGRPEIDVVLAPPRLDTAVAASSVELRGALVGKSDGSTMDIAASGIQGLGGFQGTTNAYELRVPREHAFFLLGHEVRAIAQGQNEHVKSFRIDVPPQSADGSLDLDLAALPSLPVRTVHVRAETPFGAGTTGSLTLLAADSNLLFGPIASTTADLDLSMTVPEVDPGAERIYSRVVLVAPDGARSVRAELGVIADGTTVSDFLVPVAVPEGVQNAGRPISLSGFPAGAELALEIVSNGKIGWILRGEARSSVSLFVPPGQLFPPLIAVRVVAREGKIAGTRSLYRRVAISRDLLITR